MSTINPLSGSNPIQRAYAPALSKPASVSSTSSASRTDTVELSTVNHMLGQLKTNDVRWDKVNAIKAQIANGTYETDDKLDAAAGKLLDDLA
ncbi:MAG: flagellar biosynthesis anti-sigma factor FlgM [Tepidisphaeraceae bacterium]